MGLSYAPSVMTAGRASVGKVLEGSILGSASEAKSIPELLCSPWKS